MVGLGLKGSICAALLGIAITLNAPAMAAKQSVRMTYLPSGKQVAIAALGPAAADGGKTKAIMLRYRSNKQMTDRDALAKEADDVWDLFKIDADRSGYSTAVISAELSSPATSSSRNSVNFILNKDGAGNWTCTNDKLVAVGTPAKVAYRAGLKAYTEGKVQEALADYNKSIALDPTYVQAYVDRAAIYISLNQLEKSLADSDRAISLMPSNAGAYCNRGIVNVKMGQYQDAVDDCTSAIQLNPDLGLNYAYRGIARVKLGQNEKGADDLNKAFAMNVQLGEAFYCRSVALERIAKGDRNKATELGYQPQEGRAVAQRSPQHSEQRSERKRWAR